MSRQDDLKNQIAAHNRRLQVLKEQKAIQGSSVDPKIVLEIEDIEAKIMELQTALGELEENGVDRLPQTLTSDTVSEARVIIHLEGNFASLTVEKRDFIIGGLANLLEIQPEAIKIYRIYQGSLVMELGIPTGAVHHLRYLLETNSAQLRQLSVQKVTLEKGSGEIEEWVIKEGTFNLVTPPARTTFRTRPITRSVILWAETDRATREVFSLMSKMRGFQVREASNGTQAIRTVRQAHIDLVVLDTHLPGMSGFDVARVLAQEAPNIPIIFLSSETERRKISMAFESNPAVVSYLVKSGSFNQLLGEVEKVLEGLRMEEMGVIRAKNMSAALGLDH